MLGIPRFRFALAIGLVVLFCISGCSSKPKPSDSAGTTPSRTDEQIFLGDTIERNYDPHVIIKRAEAFYEREEYPEAVVELQHFLELHRSHRLAPYAQFRLGEAFLRQARTIDRDPEPILRAESIFRKLRAEHPGSRYDEQAIARIRDCQEWLAKTHLFVGQFYHRRGAYLAAAHRYQAILTDYPDMEVAPEALYQLARTYEALGADDWAREQLTTLAQRYPDSPAHEEGRKLLAKLGGPIAPAEVTAFAASPAVERSSSGPLLTAASTPPSAPEYDSHSSVTSTRLSEGASSFVATPKFCRLGVWC